MEKLQRRLWATITNTQLALDRILPHGPQFTASRKRLDAHEREIREWSLAQEFAAMRLRHDGAAIRSLCDSLRQEHLIPARRFGNKALRWVPGMERALKVPPARANSAELVASAGRMVRALRPKKRQQAYFDAGFAKDFLARLSAAAAALEERAKHDDTIKRARVAGGRDSYLGPSALSLRTTERMPLRGLRNPRSPSGLLRAHSGAAHWCHQSSGSGSDLHLRSRRQRHCKSEHTFTTNREIGHH